VEPRTEAEDPYRLTPLRLLGTGFIGFLAGQVILRIGADRTSTSQTFVATAGFNLWAVVISVQTAYWAVVAVPLWRQLGEFGDEFRRHRARVILSLIGLAALLLGLPLFSLLRTKPPVPWPLWGHSVKTLGLTALAGLAGIPALCGVLLVQLRVNEAMRGEAKELVPRLLHADEALHRFLVIGGALVGLATLAGGTLRSAVVPQFLDEARFPQVGVLLYGAFLTAVLLFAYVPAHLTLRAAGRKVVRAHFPVAEMPEPTSDAFPGWLGKRKALSDLLKIDVTPAQQVQATLFIASPLLSAVLSLLIPKGG
jgi:hypothetical protein